ncbi:ABC transporter permease [Streptosporangium amethystogenes]|uniref:ABC transporter permease n=1 Tax=Streptosporangium amethystogenes TaxID=2002 RepID=UPI0004C88A7F|nr:ABC transporter permease [Streptosporangium amethystogenes]
MLWLTWRQHRAQILVTGALLFVLGLLLLVSGLRASSYITEQAPPGCPGPAAACSAVNSAIYDDYYYPVFMVFGLLPILGSALIGAFWGAPLLAAEFERGTNALAWTQSVSTGRWLVTKLCLLGGVVVVAALILSAMIGAWLPVFRDVIGDKSLEPGTFTLIGVVPAAWWLYAFVLGAAAGTLFRRTLAAMAVTVALVALTVPAVFFSRDSYAEPVRAVTTGSTAIYQSGGALVREAWLTPSGQEIAAPPAGECPSPAGVDVRSERAQLLKDECLLDEGYRKAVYYHPTSRFWRFQWTESGILLAAALVLGGLTVTRTLHRRN